MTTAKKISTIAGTGYYVNGDYAAQRNIKKSEWGWLPGDRKLRMGPFGSTKYVYDHNNNRIVLWNGIKSSDSKDNLNNMRANGFTNWTPGNDRSGVATMSVDKKLAYHHWHYIGWDPEKTSSSDVTALKGESCAPITNFIGISFKWDGWGSYWNNRAIGLEPDTNISRSSTNNAGGGVSLTVYNAQTNKIHSLFTFRDSYKGWDIFTARQDNTGESNKSDNNHVFFKMASADQTYVLNNPVFLIGLTMQGYNPERGGATHTRRLNLWDLNPIFNPSIGGGYESRGAKLVLPAIQSNALQKQYDIHGRGQTKVPVAINLG